MEDVKQELTITSDLGNWNGEIPTRVNTEGTAFNNDDLIRLKVICPFSPNTERGESTDGNSSDGFFLLFRNGNSWSPVTARFGFDVDGSFYVRDAPSIAGYYEAQQTPFVYTATTWTEEKVFVAPTSSTNKTSVIDQYSNVFHADQTKEKNYRASDVLWAQTFMQTGAWNIHLSFQHKMACLEVTIDDSGLTKPNPDYDPEADESSPTIPAPISATAVLTLEGMPDIDQAEIVIGDYYADASKVNSNYGYRQKTSCSYENNGKVLGVAVIDEGAYRAKVAQMSGNPTPGGSYSSTTTAVPNTGTYTAYNMGNKTYRLIVPPCILTDKAVFWLRDGERRYSIALENKTFIEGNLYPITLKVKSI